MQFFTRHCFLFAHNIPDMIDEIDKQGNDRDVLFLLRFLYLTIYF